MKQEHNQSYTILDAEYQVIDEPETIGRGIQKGVIITALGLTALGLAALFFPVAAGIGFAFFITAGIFLSGISQIMIFFRTAKEQRNGWMLANGVLLVLVSGLNLAGALISPMGIPQMITTVSFLLGILTMSIGLNQITGILSEKGKTPGRGWALLSGVLNVLLSLLLFVNPILSWFALTTVWGIYLLAAAIALFCTLWSMRRSPHTSSSV